MGRGYYNNEALTTERFITNPFPESSNRWPRLYNTGDLARRLPDGNIEFLGRSDHQVKIRGHRVEMQEVETHLTALPNIAEAVVTDMKYPSGETCLCAYIVPDSDDVHGGGDLEPSELRHLLLDSVPDYMVPAYFVIMERIPLTTNGKVDRKQLPQPVTHISKGYIAPRHEIDRELIDIWVEILGVEKSAIGVETDFFDLGGHSLNAAMLISRVHQTFGAKIPLGHLFENPTVSGLARHIKTVPEDKTPVIEAPVSGVRERGNFRTIRWVGQNAAVFLRKHRL